MQACLEYNFIVNDLEVFCRKIVRLNVQSNNIKIYEIYDKECRSTTTLLVYEPLAWNLRHWMF